ncbi:MAG TPA: glycine cleavage system aminomethyltransferase GcvT, partial [Bacillota bacterium]
MAEGKRTPLFPVYAEYGARTVDFGGWELPLQFSGILTEHEAVRRAVGLFDVSHMGEIEVSGPQALAVVQRVITNDAARLRDGRALYSPICRPDGGILDDVLVYRFDPRRFLIVVNAANRQRDVEHWQAVAADLAGDQAQVRDASDDYALLALQGPRAAAVLARLYEGPEEFSPLGIKPFAFVTDVPLAGRRARLVSRTGYTGEDGFELYLQPEDAIPLWRALLVAGEAEQIQPAGLG